MRDYLLVLDALRPLFPFLVLGVTAYFGRRFIRALEHRAESRAELTELRSRIAQLEEEVDTTNRDMMRVQASQDFAAQLLGNRLSEPHS